MPWINARSDIIDEIIKDRVGVILGPYVATKEEVEAARALYAAGSSHDIEVDDDAATSPADGGTWVMMWGWVPDPDDPDDGADPDDDDHSDQATPKTIGG